MLARQRQARILDEVRRRGGVRVSDLTSLLGVSDMTVRRDLEELARQGAVEKVHGGAVVAGRSTDEPGFEAKAAWKRQEKDAIARAAAALVPPGSAVALSAGTTTWALARHLAWVPDLTVVTNSLSVAEELRAGTAARQTVVLTGGVRTPSNALVGPVADSAIRSLYVDVLFLGVHGMDPQAGFTTPNLAEAETNRTFVERARRVVVLADHSKWGTVGLAGFGPLSLADLLVTDAGIDNRSGGGAAGRGTRVGARTGGGTPGGLGGDSGDGGDDGDSGVDGQPHTDVDGGRPDARELLSAAVGELLVVPVTDQAGAAGAGDDPGPDGVDTASSVRPRRSGRAAG